MIFTIIFIAGCKKDPVDKNDCKCCTDCTTLLEPIIPTIYQNQYQYKFPCFNPKNNNEIIFFNQDLDNNINQILKLNLVSKQKTVLINDIIIISQPRWGLNDWIILNTINHEIWKIKSNGDSLAKIVSGGSNLYPAYNNNYTELIYTYSLNAGIPYYILRKNINTNKTDTIFNSRAKYLTVSNNNKLVCIGDYSTNLQLSELSNNLMWNNLTNVNVEGQNQIKGISWHSNCTDIYYTRFLKGLYKINIFEKKEVKIKNSCNSKKYTILSISPDDSKIVVERINGYVSSDNKLYNDSRLYIMNIDGCNEQEIQIQ